MRVWVKSMTKDAQDYDFYTENGYMKTIFTNRQKTGLTKGFQGIRSLATRMSVNFFETDPWYTYIPIIGWFNIFASGDDTY